MSDLEHFALKTALEQFYSKFPRVCMIGTVKNLSALVGKDIRRTRFIRLKSYSQGYSDGEIIQMVEETYEMLVTFAKLLPVRAMLSRNQLTSEQIDDEIERASK